MIIILYYVPTYLLYHDTGMTLGDSIKERKVYVLFAYITRAKQQIPYTQAGRKRQHSTQPQGDTHTHALS